MKSLKTTQLTIILSTTVSLTLFSCLYENPNDRTRSLSESFKTDAKIKSILETDYEGKVKFDKIQKGKKQIVSRSHFNTNEKIIEYSLYEPNGSLISKKIYNYDENGRLIEETEYSNDKVLEKTLFTYDDFGRKTGQQYFDNLGMVTNHSNTTIYKYDYNGNMVEEIINYLGGSQGYHTFSYDERGNKIKEKHLSSDYEVIYKYDEKNNLIETNIITGTILGNRKDSYKYDENGIIVEQVINVFEKEVIVRFKYERYDKSGNWLLKTESYLPAMNFTITERVIEYY